MTLANDHPGVAGSQQGPIQLDWREQGRTVVVCPQDEDRFLMTVQDAAEACRPGQEVLRWRAQLDKLIVYVHEWVKRHVDRVSATYMATADGRLTFFVVPEGTTMDFELSDEIAQLDLEIAHEFDLCKCEVRQIPGRDYAAIATFLDLERAVVLYGNPPTASGTVEA